MSLSEILLRPQVASQLSLTLDSFVQWFHGSIPRSWLSHALIWLAAQSAGGLIDLSVRGIRPGGRLPAHLFRLIGFSSAALYYGVRETLDTSRGITTRDLVLTGDSVMDFLLPAVVNTLLLLWLYRRSPAAGEEEPTGRSGSVRVSRLFPETPPGRPTGVDTGKRSPV